MIYILGDGVAGRVAHHFLHLHKIEHKIIRSKSAPKTNNISGGVRYLEPPLADQKNYKRLLGAFTIDELFGGVIAGEEVFSWKIIFQQEAYKHYLSGMYAIDKKRPWSPSIMNKLCLRTEVPAYVSNVTYADLLAKLHPIDNEDIITVDVLSSIDPTERKLYWEKDGERFYSHYTQLVSSLPMNVLLELLCFNKIQLSYSQNKEYSQKLSRSNLDQMWYIMRHGPIKRISVIDDIIKIEMRDTGLDPHEELRECITEHNLLALISTVVRSEILLPADSWDISKLPPNFSVEDSNQLDTIRCTLQGLQIFSVGRFAEAAPKMMFGDIIESAAHVAEFIELVLLAS